VYLFSYTTGVEACISVYVCAVYLSVLESVPFTEKIKFSSTNMWWIYTGVEFERSQRFLFWNFYLNNASSVGQTRCNCSDHLFIRGVFSTQPMFQSMEPTGACQVYILPRHQATSIFDKKIWRKKTRIVTFSGKLYIVSSIVCHLTKLENMGLFLN